MKVAEEIQRRGFNVMEALIVAALMGMSGTIWMTRDAVIELKAVVAYQTKALDEQRAQLANVPALSERVSRNEVRLEALERQAQREQTP